MMEPAQNSANFGNLQPLSAMGDFGGGTVVIESRGNSFVLTFERTAFQRRFRAVKTSSGFKKVERLEPKPLDLKVVLQIDKSAAAQHGLDISDANSMISSLKSKLARGHLFKRDGYSGKCFPQILGSAEILEFKNAKLKRSDETGYFFNNAAVENAWIAGKRRNGCFDGVAQKLDIFEGSLLPAIPAVSSQTTAAPARRGFLARILTVAAIVTCAALALFRPAQKNTPPAGPGSSGGTEPVPAVEPRKIDASNQAGRITLVSGESVQLVESDAISTVSAEIGISHEHSDTTKRGDHAHFHEDHESHHHNDNHHHDHGISDGYNEGSNSGHRHEHGSEHADHMGHSHGGMIPEIYSSKQVLAFGLMSERVKEENVGSTSIYFDAVVPIRTREVDGSLAVARNSLGEGVQAALSSQGLFRFESGISILRSTEHHHEGAEDEATSVAEPDSVLQKEDHEEDHHEDGIHITSAFAGVALGGSQSPYRFRGGILRQDGGFGVYTTEAFSLGGRRDHEIQLSSLAHKDYGEFGIRASSSLSSLELSAFCRVRAGWGGVSSEHDYYNWGAEAFLHRGAITVGFSTEKHGGEEEPHNFELLREPFAHVDGVMFAPEARYRFARKFSLGGSAQLAKVATPKFRIDCELGTGKYALQLTGGKDIRPFIKAGIILR